VDLTVETKDDLYEFSYSTQKNYDDVVGSIKCSELLRSSPKDAPFTGVMFGMYVVGKTPAEFPIMILTDSLDR
jgi:Beta xylosidase C-terminal Concanavalin A-like domain